jgi:hypothetical protein
MGRSVSYPSEATVVTFSNPEYDCEACEGDEPMPDCAACHGYGTRSMDSDDFDMLIDDFRDHLRFLFPSVQSADDWIGREDHVLAENQLARFGMSEYCGLVAYWIVPREDSYGEENNFARAWIKQIADKFVAAFGELSKVGSMSNGEGVYRRIDK